MNKFILSHPRKRSCEDEEFEVDNPALFKSCEKTDSLLNIIQSTIENISNDKSQNYLLDSKYFKIVTVNGPKLLVSCQNCHKQITAHSNFTGNLLSHYKVSYLTTKYFI